MSNNDKQSTHRTGRLTHRNKAEDSGSHASEIKPQKESDEVIGAIEGVEKQLNALRDAHEEHRKLTADLAARRTQIDEFAELVEARESELSDKEVELAEMRQELEERESEIVQRASGLEQRESQIAQHAERIEALEAVVETKAGQVDQRIEELDTQLEGISVRKDELAKLEAQAKQRLEEDSKLQIQIQELSTELEKTKAALGGREIELKERAKVVEDLAVQAGLLEKQMAELVSKSKADEAESLEMVEQMQARLDETLRQVNTHDEAMERALSRIDELESIVSIRDKDLKQAATQISKLTDLEKAKAESEAASMKQIATLESKLAESKAEFKSAQAALSSAPSNRQLAKIQKQLDQTSKELKESRAACKLLETKLQSVGSNATKELESSKAQIAKLGSELSQAKSELKATVESQRKAQQELHSKLDERDKRIASIDAKYQEVSEQLLSEQVSAEESKAKVTQMQRTLEAANAHEQELAQELADLNELVQSEQSKGQLSSDEWSLNRRERLRRVKAMLRQQSDKVRRATEALRDRYDQCEQVLLKRSELVEAYQAISEAQTKLAKREARSGTLLGLSGLGLFVMMIAGASWFIAGQVMPGSYASRVTLTAKAGERSLSTEDIASWQGYVEGLVTDPQFIEQAAARMKRRGITDLAVAGSLSAHMSESLDVVSAEPGKIEFEYRGDGAARTQRILDTYALAITSQANAARARRIDGALTSIESAASVGESPLDSARIETAGMIFGGTTLGTFALGGIFWRRLAKVKANFERDNRVEPLFDEDSWEVEGKSA